MCTAPDLDRKANLDPPCFQCNPGQRRWFGPVHSRETPFPENGLCPSLAGRIDKTPPIIQWINAATGFAALRFNAVSCFGYRSRRTDSRLPFVPRTSARRIPGPRTETARSSARHKIAPAGSSDRPDSGSSVPDGTFSFVVWLESRLPAGLDYQNGMHIDPVAPWGGYPVLRVVGLAKLQRGTSPKTWQHAQPNRSFVAATAGQGRSCGRRPKRH